MDELLEKIVDHDVSRKQSVIKIVQFNTVIGSMMGCAVDDGICLLEFCDSVSLLQRINRMKRLYQLPVVSGRHALFKQLKQEIKQYLAGNRTDFGVPLSMNGTEFQLGVWRTLLRVRYGKTLTYAELAGRTGKPSAIRATAAANGANALSILVPCHRVQATDGNLTGYGGGIHRKAWLLDLESGLKSTSAT